MTKLLATALLVAVALVATIVAAQAAQPNNQVVGAPAAAATVDGPDDVHVYVAKVAHSTAGSSDTLIGIENKFADSHARVVDKLDEVLRRVNKHVDGNRVVEFIEMENESEAATEVEAEVEADAEMEAEAEAEKPRIIRPIVDDTGRLAHMPRVNLTRFRVHPIIEEALVHDAPLAHGRALEEAHHAVRRAARATRVAAHNTESIAAFHRAQADRLRSAQRTHRQARRESRRSKYHNVRITAVDAELTQRAARAEVRRAARAARIAAHVTPVEAARAQVVAAAAATGVTAHVTPAEEAQAAVVAAAAATGVVAHVTPLEEAQAAVAAAASAAGVTAHVTPAEEAKVAVLTASAAAGFYAADGSVINVRSLVEVEGDADAEVDSEAEAEMEAQSTLDAEQAAEFEAGLQAQNAMEAEDAVAMELEAPVYPIVDDTGSLAHMPRVNLKKFRVRPIIEEKLVQDAPLARGAALEEAQRAVRHAARAARITAHADGHHHAFLKDAGLALVEEQGIVYPIVDDTGSFAHMPRVNLKKYRVRPHIEERLVQDAPLAQGAELEEAQRAVRHAAHVARITAHHSESVAALNAAKANVASLRSAEAAVRHAARAARINAHAAPVEAELTVRAAEAEVRRAARAARITAHVGAGGKSLLEVGDCPDCANRGRTQDHPVVMNPLAVPSSLDAGVRAEQHRAVNYLLKDQQLSISERHLSAAHEAARDAADAHERFAEFKDKASMEPLVPQL